MCDPTYIMTFLKYVISIINANLCFPELNIQYADKPTTSLQLCQPLFCCWFQQMSFVIVTLTITTLWANAADDTLIIFSPESRL